MVKRIFITGTGTDVGKTHIAALLTKKWQESGVKTAYYKPVASGNRRGADGRLIPGDALAVKTLAGLPQPLATMSTYCYEQAVSPHLAAAAEGNPVELAPIAEAFRYLTQHHDVVTVEGAGGILTPLYFGDKPILIIDLIDALDLPCLIVADAGLGTINAVSLTAAYLHARRIPVAGLIFNRYQANNPMHIDNRRVCEALTGLRTIASVPEGVTELDVPLQTLHQIYT